MIASPQGVSNSTAQIERRGAWLAVLLATLLAVASFTARAEGSTAADTPLVVHLVP